MFAVPSCCENLSMSFDGFSNEGLAKSISLTISSLKQSYTADEISPIDVVTAIIEELKSRRDDGVWTYRVPPEELRSRATTLQNHPSPEQLPLWGIPFSVKDCIDIAGLPTSAGCPEFAYTAERTNPVVQKLLDAGAMLIGKTNLDQFATGLVGIRTGYDRPHNAFDANYIPGGSSSGAALSVALGLVSFAVGTDTGGSGRVPAGFNNIVGLKPTRGVLSTAHTVEACKTLDCLSIFSLTARDAQTVFDIVKGVNAKGGNKKGSNLSHPFSRPVEKPTARRAGYQQGQSFCFGVPQPRQRAFFGNAGAKENYEEAIKALEQLGGTSVEIDYRPFLEANELLFNGPWVAERYASVGAFVEKHSADVFPITREIILSAKERTAVEAFEGFYSVERLKHSTQPLWEEIDFLVVPTTGTIYRIEEVEADPLRLNANLGYYTNFVNLLDLCAIALPNGFQTNGLPTGITFIAPPHSESYLVDIGAAFHPARCRQLGATAFKL